VEAGLDAVHVVDSSLSKLLKLNLLELLLGEVGDVLLLFVCRSFTVLFT